MIQFRRDSMNVETMEDINYLAQQSSDNLNMILAKMFFLMKDTDKKIDAMESQVWYQRMIKTVLGKNKVTKREIQQNHDKLNAYMSEVIAELFNRQCVDNQIIIGLGTQLNEIYAEQLKLRRILGAFVEKFNEKINSIDNYNILKDEIDIGKYSGKDVITSVCSLLSQFDRGILEDDRKLEIIKIKMLEKDIINNDSVLLSEYLYSIKDINIEDVGKVYLELNLLKNNTIAAIFRRIIENYYFLSEDDNSIKEEKDIIKSILEEQKIDESMKLSSVQMYDMFLNNKIEVDKKLQIMEKLNDPRLIEAKELYFNCKFDEALELFLDLAEDNNPRAMYFLGKIYSLRYGHVEHDIDKAKIWYKRGHEMGDIFASLNVAYFLPDGNVEKNVIIDEVFNDILKMAEEGDVFAQDELANIYLLGYQGENNRKEGIKWLEKAAQNDFWGSMNALGDLYYYGLLVMQDYGEAFKWYTMGTEKENAYSCFCLACCYYLHRGVEFNREMAFKLLEKANELGSSNSEDVIEIIKNRGYGFVIVKESECCNIGGGLNSLFNINSNFSAGKEVWRINDFTSSAIDRYMESQRKNGRFNFDEIVNEVYEMN